MNLTKSKCLQLAVQVIEGKSMAPQLLKDIKGYDFQPAAPINSDLLSTLVAQAEDEVLREILSSKEQLQQQVAEFGTHQGMMAEDPLGVLAEVRGGHWG
jgi:SAM-dependent MidA family methyltransferase